MIRPDFRKRDGLARTGTLAWGENCRIRLPAVIDERTMFPGLESLRQSNLPLVAPASLVNRYPPPGETVPVILHPQLANRAESGDCVMVPGWHTAFDNPKNYVEWLIILRERTPPDTAWYAPACALPSRIAILCYTGFDFFDYTAVDLKSVQGRFCTPEGDLPGEAIAMGICSCPGCAAGDLYEHNRSVLRGEIARTAWFIEYGQIRDLVESRCRMDAGQVAILRRLDQQYTLMEKALPVARSGIMRANSAESLRRPEVRRFMGRVAERYLPPAADVAVLLPCSAKKPYSLSRSHRKFQAAIAGRAHELIITSPLGLVPRDIECVYPAGHYDVPVTGYWDAEECSVIAGVLGRYLRKHPYRRIIAHLEGGALQVAEHAAATCGITLEYSCREDPATLPALEALDAALAGERRIRDNRLRGMISCQFGCDIDPKGIVAQGRFPELYFRRGGSRLFSLDRATGLIRPTLDGWDLLPGRYRVQIGDFIPEGDVLVPGVTGADPAIRDGDEVLVEGPRARATGRAAMPAGEMLRSRRGVAVRVRKVKKIDVQQE